MLTAAPTILTLLLMALLSPVLATESPEPDGHIQAPALFKELGGGLYVMGDVHIDANSGQVTFPATVNMQSGLLEYLLVTATGKAHESLLVTEIEPYHLQAALLLLGIKGAQTNAPEVLPSAIDRNVLAKIPEITGELVEISFIWNQEGKRNEVPAETWVLMESGAPVAKGPWIYSGSRFYGASYLAQELGSIVALVKDPDAMINNPRPGNTDDKLWIPNEKSVPQVGTSIEIRITLVKSNFKNELQSK